MIAAALAQPSSPPTAAAFAMVTHCGSSNARHDAAQLKKLKEPSRSA